MIINIFAQNIVEISQNSFGNYAIQHALDLWKFNKCKPIFEELLKNFVKLASQRYSSKVAEKLILDSDIDSLTRVVEVLEDENKLLGLLTSKFGNFVLNKLMTKVKGGELLHKLEAGIAEATKKIKQVHS